MQYEKFDLEIALKNPERVVTRDGRKIDEIFHFKKAVNDDFNVGVIIEGILDT